MTMESFQSTRANNAGHLYTQFYPLSKNQFFAKGIYPFQNENETIEGLAMRTVSHEIMRACERRERFDPVACVVSLKLSGNRIALELEGNDDRTYGVRQEHRISFALFGAMVSIFQVRKWPAIDFPEAYRPYVVHPTSLMNKFTQNVFFTWSRFFQEILGSAPAGYLSTDQRKLACLAAIVMRNCWGASQLSRHSVIWKGKYDFGRKESGPHGAVTGSNPLRTPLTLKRLRRSKDIGIPGVPFPLETDIRYSTRGVHHPRDCKGFLTSNEPLGKDVRRYMQRGRTSRDSDR